MNKFIDFAKAVFGVNLSNTQAEMVSKVINESSPIQLPGSLRSKAYCNVTPKDLLNCDGLCEGDEN